MVTTTEITAFDRGTDPILRFFSVDQARELVHYQAEDSLQERIAYLDGHANEGELTSEERAEYEGYIRANKFVAVLQAKARKMLAAAEA